LRAGRPSLAALLAAAGIALAVAGCGGDSESTVSTAASPATTTSASEQTTTGTEPATTESEPTTTEDSGGVGPGETTTQTTTEDSGGGGGGGNANGGGGTPSYDPSQPDSPQNDIPAAPGTPQGNFEQYCQQNPGACG
jgi:hypothetical protein